MKAEVLDSINFLNENQSAWVYRYVNRHVPGWDEGAWAHERRRKRDGLMDYPTGPQIIRYATRLKKRKAS